MDSVLYQLTYHHHGIGGMMSTTVNMQTLGNLSLLLVGEEVRTEIQEEV
jgi:hypothetical protein